MHTLSSMAKTSRKSVVSSKAELLKRKEKQRKKLKSKSKSGGFESLKGNEKQRKKSKSKLKSGGFESLKLSYNVLKAIKRKRYQVPTPIQRETMPLILSGCDVVAMARTGSGKTAAFLIPMLQKLRQHNPKTGIRALILSPTRDLALQTLKFTHQLGRYTDLRASLLVGGDSMESQFEELAQNPDIVIATPGRLMHHLSEVDDMSLRTVEYVVFDEADTLFGMGFAEQLHIILTQLSENRQTLLFSATLPRALAEFAKAGLQDPQFGCLDVERTISEMCELIFFTLRPEEKHAALIYLIREHIDPNKKILIFVSTRYHTEFLEKLLALEGIESNICHGRMDSEARKINLSKFRSGKIKVLIVSDVASRGMDIPLLDYVINWDFPSNPKLFVHRVGRVARAGQTGAAYSFVTPEDMPYLLDLRPFLSRVLKPAPTEEEVLKNIDVMDKINHSMANGVAVYGRFPQTVLDLVQDKVRDVIRSSADLQSLQKTCIHAFLKYSKSKPVPSKESIRSVKYLPREGLHPMFKGVLEGNELTALAFAECLKSFRPKQTILEAEGRNALSKHLQGPMSQWVDVMKKKRAIHEKIINQVHQNCSSDNSAKEEKVEPEIYVKTKGNEETVRSKRKAKNFMDEEYFISPVPTNQHLEAGLSMRAEQGFGSNRLDSAVMDLVPDDSEGMQKQKRVYHWDKKSKKYIKLNNGERVMVSGKVKTEGGQKVMAKKTGIYAKWKASTHNKIALRGTDNECHGPPVGLAGGQFVRRFKGCKPRNQQRSIPNAHVPSEIKDLEQIRKERQKKSQQALGKNLRKGNRFGNVKKRKGK